MLPFLPNFIHDYKWYDTNLDNHITNAFHALALDEKRYPFSPAVWERRPGCTTNLKQVWFPGVHSNVGGSYKDHDLADITLAWMMDQLANTAGQRDDPENFTPREWIAFDKGYVDQQHKRLKHYYKKHAHDYPTARGWARGKIFDSLSFPMSLLGTCVRQPGRYRATDYQTGKETGALLQGTHEYMHASVRARADLSGNGYEDDPEEPLLSRVARKTWNFLTGSWWRNPYLQHLRHGPLRDWRLDDGHEHHDKPNLTISTTPTDCKQVEWRYEGKDRLLHGKQLVMTEDKLGVYERQLLNLDKDNERELVEAITFSNNRFEHIAKPTEKEFVRHVHHNGTM